MLFLSPSRSNTPSPTALHNVKTASMPDLLHTKLALPDAPLDDTFSTESMYIYDTPMSMSEFDHFPNINSYESSSSLASPVSSRGASRQSSNDSYSSMSTVGSLGISTPNPSFNQTIQMLPDWRLSAIEGKEFETSFLPSYGPKTEPFPFFSTEICAQPVIPYGAAPADYIAKQVQAPVSFDGRFYLGASDHSNCQRFEKSQVRRFYCRYCTGSVGRLDNLHAHYKTKHPHDPCAHCDTILRPLKFKCDECGMKFATRDDLSNHIEAKHAQES